MAAAAARRDTAHQQRRQPLVRRRALLPLVASASNITALDAHTAARGVQQLAFVSIDLQADLGMRDATGDELLFFRTAIVLASRHAGSAFAASSASTRSGWQR